MMHRRTLLSLIVAAIFTPAKLMASADEPIAPDGSFIYADFGLESDRSAIALVEHSPERNYFIIHCGHSHTEKEVEALVRRFMAKLRGQFPDPPIPGVGFLRPLEETWHVIPASPLKRASFHFQRFLRDLFK